MIIGIDGLPYSLAKKLAARGKPGFKELFAEGMAIPGTSSVPFVSCTAWTSAASGRNPAKHGVFGFLDLRYGSYDHFIPLSPDVQCSRIWHLAQARGKKVALLGVPVTYPPERVNGLCVSGFLAPSLAKAVYPPEYLQHLTALGYALDVDPRTGHESKRALLRQIAKNLAARANAIVHCLQTESPDLFFAHVIETDRLNHFLFDVIETETGELAEEAMAVYDLVADLLLRVVKALPSGAVLIVCSDHGFCTARKVVQVNDILARMGWTAYEGRQRSHADISPKARAFSLDPGRVYIHTASRYPKGPIAEKDRDRVAEELRQELTKALINDSMRERSAERILSRHEVFSGPLLHAAPDLVIMPERGCDLKGAVPGKGVATPGALVGMHTFDDAFLGVMGCKITVAQSNVTDIGPSALALLGIDPEPQTDGRVILT